MQDLRSSLFRSEVKKSIPSHLRLRARIFLLAAAFLSLLLSPTGTAFAGSATWGVAPASGDWNTATNWTPNTVPNGPSDVATFASSSQRAVSLSADVEVNEIVFSPGASGFAIDWVSTAVLTISGAGVTNDSGLTQQFVVEENENGDEDGLRFTNNATAGTDTSLIAMPGETFLYGSGGAIFFQDQSSADHSAIQVFGKDVDAFFPGELTFSDNSTAGDATITTLGVSGGFVGELTFFGESTAGNATINNGRIGPAGGFFYFLQTATGGTSQITNNGLIFFIDSASLDQATITNVPNSTNSPDTGSVNFTLTATAATGTIVNQGGTAAGTNGAATNFGSSSTAGNATLIADAGSNGGGGGVIAFDYTTDGDRARIEVFGNGSLDISAHNVPGVTTGSLEGDGLVFLGANNLTVGSNNLSTTFSGVIQDSGAGGSFTKIGTSTLTLTGENTYTGGTTIEGGRLWVNNMSGSGTGSGGVQVNAGTLGGRGTITGAVTVGTGSGAGAVLAPGRRGGRPGNPLTIQSTLTFKSDATYEVGLSSVHAVADKVVAAGVTIESGALFSFLSSGHGTLTPGTVFTVIDNTSGTPIGGTFANLADSSTFTVGSNTFQASYEGGDGNDLTLTVVP
jgi:autotransporter-associated beta strand protein